MEQNIRENGEKTNKMDMEKKPGQMKLFLKVNIKMERKTEKECFIGKMIAVMKEISKIIIFMEMENIFGKMVAFTKANGRITKCKGRGFLHGQMAEDMKDSMLMIKRKDLVHFFFEMVGFMKGNGKMGSSTEKDCLRKRM